MYSTPCSIYSRFLRAIFIYLPSSILYELRNYCPSNYNPNYTSYIRNQINYNHGSYSTYRIDIYTVYKNEIYKDRPNM